MQRKWSQPIVVASIAVASMLAAGCGDLVRQGRSPVQLVVVRLEAAPGNTPNEMGANLLSDVITTVERQVNGQTVPVDTVFNDVGEVTLSLILKDPGQPGTTAEPSALNQVTVNRYRVAYRRSDGRNTPGVDVPFPIDAAVTFTVPANGEVTSGFEIVRHIAKEEAPLARLRNSRDVIATMTDVTFFGRDMAGNDISVTGTIAINFGNFADPD